VKLDQRLEEAVISFTDKFLHFPCIVGRPKVEYLPFYHWHFKIRGTDRYTDTLYVACMDKSEKEISEAIYEGLLNKRKSLYKINDRDRYLLKLFYYSRLDDIKRAQRKYL